MMNDDPMVPYRSLATIKAVQYHSAAIPDIVCYGEDADVLAYGCDASRKAHPHVHTAAVGGMTVLKDGDFIVRVPGGPFAVYSEEFFSANWDTSPPVAEKPVDVKKSGK